MQPLIISYSGIRGIVGESLNEEVAYRFGRSFAQLLGAGAHKVLVARDSRPSGPQLVRGLVRGLGPPPIELIDLGVVPTPTLQFSMRPFGAGGAACITASHNPSAWNGMKFFLGPANTVLDGEQTRRLCALADVDHPAAMPPPPRLRDAHAEAIRLHVAEVCAQVAVDRIRARRFRVALDSAQGAGVEATQALLNALGCDVVVVKSSRESEPVPENLGELQSAVVKERCALGLAQDLDADRLALVTETGEAPGEERTLVLVIDHLLKRRAEGARTVVKNVATTRAVDDVVAAHGAKLRETRVGEINLSRALAEEIRAGRAAFGGEGNGGVILPAVSFGRDSLVGTALVLECLAGGTQSLSTRLAALPNYAMRKARLPLHAPAGIEPLQRRIVALFPDGIASYADGLKIDFPDRSWLLIRPSNTEPIMRVVAESPSASWAAEAVQRIENAARLP